MKFINDGMNIGFEIEDTRPLKAANTGTVCYARKIKADYQEMLLREMYGGYDD